MKQPTREQIKEFWEWCGLVSFKDRLGVVYEYDRKLHKSPPDLDLNNLFKYAVPKLDNIKLVKNVAPSGDVFWNGTAEYIPNVKVVTHEDPALALFWAIWEVIKK